MIGQNIRRMRKLKGWSQETLAHKMGYKDKTAINKIENNINYINQKKINKFAEIFGCDPTYLMLDSTTLTVELSDFEEQIIHAFRNASTDTQAAVCAVLGLKGDIELPRASYIDFTKEA